MPETLGSKPPAHSSLAENNLQLKHAGHELRPLNRRGVFHCGRRRRSSEADGDARGGRLGVCHVCIISFFLDCWGGFQGNSDDAPKS